MVHRRNVAERAIQTFKDHFIAGLASVDPQFPMHEWNRLLPQAIITLNLLRNARVNPKLSSYAYIFLGFSTSTKHPLHLLALKFQFIIKQINVHHGPEEVHQHGILVLQWNIIVVLLAMIQQHAKKKFVILSSSYLTKFHFRK